MCPNSRGVPLYKGNFRGLCLPKRVPQPRPNSAPFTDPTIAFAYTQTVVWANANGCRKGSESLLQRHLYRVRTVPTPYKGLSERGKGTIRMEQRRHF